MRLQIIVPFVLCIIMTIGSAQAVWGNGSEQNLSENLSLKDSAALTRMDQSATDLYHAAVANNRQAAHKHIQQLQNIVESEIRLEIGKAEGWISMEKDIASIREILVSGAKNQGWLQQAARIRLAADALNRPERALWLQYDRVLLDDFSRIDKAWKRNGKNRMEATRASLLQLQEHAERIEPAIQILHGASIGGELKERIRYTNQLLAIGSTGPNHVSLLNDSLAALNRSIIRLYEQSGDGASISVFSPVATAQPLRWALFLGAIISAVLTYIGWRKYKAEPYGVKPIG